MVRWYRHRGRTAPASYRSQPPCSKGPTFQRADPPERELRTQPDFLARRALCAKIRSPEVHWALHSQSERARRRDAVSPRPTSPLDPELSGDTPSGRHARRAVQKARDAEARTLVPLGDSPVGWPFLLSTPRDHSRVARVARRLAFSIEVRQSSSLRWLVVVSRS